MREFITFGALLILLAYAFLTILAVGFIFMGVIKKMRRMVNAGLILFAFIIVTLTFITVRSYHKHKPVIAMRKIPGHYEAYKIDQGNVTSDSLKHIRLIVSADGSMEVTANPYTPFSGKAYWEYTEANDCELSIYYGTSFTCSPVSFYMLGNELLINTDPTGSNYLHFRKYE